jgi:hypothetical protein
LDNPKPAAEVLRGIFKLHWQEKLTFLTMTGTFCLTTELNKSLEIG